MDSKKAEPSSALTPQTILGQAILNDRVAHAYLFYGPELSVQLEVAKFFAQSLNCPEFSKGKEPCGVCSGCQKIHRGTHPDVVLWGPQGALRKIRIEQIRQLQEEAWFKPYEGKVKVHILQEADCLNPAASNAFLKILEEPPQKTFFLLLTTEPEMLLPTIISRCQGLEFRSDSELFLHELFPECENDSALLEVLKEFSRGSVKKAKMMIESGLWAREKLFVKALAKAVEDPMMICVFSEAEKIVSMLDEDMDILEEKLREGEKEIDDSKMKKEFEEDLEAFLSGERHRRIRELLRLFLAWARIYHQKNESFRAFPHWVEAVEEAQKILDRGGNLKWVLEALLLKVRD